MRIRRKKWAYDELNNSKLYIQNPCQFIKKWDEQFQNNNEIHIEIGCGKGLFISKLAKENPNINYLAIDIVEAMLGLTKRNIEKEFLNISDDDRLYIATLKSKDIDIKEYAKNENKDLNKKERAKEIVKKLEKVDRKSIPNVLILKLDALNIDKVFSKEDKISRIYLNFSNPWPKEKHFKRRLTHPNKLSKYIEFLKSGGEIFFKTDDLNFFNDSIKYFESFDEFDILYETYDLENEDIFNRYDSKLRNILTEHEKMFKEESKKINALIAKRK